MSSNRRDEIRRRKRIAVRFWKRGEDTARSGFTTNISTGGMFIGANHVLSRGTRLRVEVMDPGQGFMVEGVVARAERSRPELRSVRTSGMGIRFLKVDELVAELFPQAEQVSVAAQPRPAPQPSAPEPVAPQPASQVAEPWPPVPQPAVPQPAAPQPAAPQPATAEPEPEPIAPQSTRHAAQLRGFAVRYASLDDLRRTYERDIQNGGLFISTQTPAERGDVVVIEIRPPEELGAAFRLRARVVHTFERGTQGGTHEANLLAGMGVEWLDPEAARKSFEFYLRDAESA